METTTKKTKLPKAPNLGEVAWELADLHDLVEELPSHEPRLINGERMADEAILASLRNWIAILETEARARKEYEEAVAARREIIVEARCFARELGNAIDEETRAGFRDRGEPEGRAIPTGHLPWGN
jgi:hypothetical protein